MIYQPTFHPGKPFIGSPRRWRINGTWEDILTTLAGIERKKHKKTNLRVYSQAIRCVLKTRSAANIETKGYGHYKSTNGIKRHLLADVSGNPYFVKCTAANISDEGLLEIIKAHIEYFLDLPDEHIITILLDNG